MLSSQQVMHYKEKNPDQTVAYLKSILERLNVEIDEIWQDESSIGTFALRVVFKGTNIGTNGKGVSREYALASAYAEFFERYQNDLLGPRVYFKDNSIFKLSPDEKIQSSSQLAKKSNAFIDMYFSQRGLANATVSQKAKAFYETQKIDLNVYQMDDKYITVPFYSVKQKKTVYLPKSTYTVYYGSNGMCAGNSPEEALVQGLAEIIERVAQRKILIEKPSLPDIPDEYVARFPYIYDMYKKLKSNSNFECVLKDCSFGGKYPVAALVLIEKNTGRFGIKLGCHPDYGVALERAFTEATQGQDIFEYTKRSYIDFSNDSVDNWRNIYNSYKFGMGQYPFQIFSKESSAKFTPVEDVSMLTNVELLRKWINSILDDGFDLLIRDVSTFGFPSYHIIIPNMSEMMYPDDFRYRATNTRYFISKLINESPEKINRDNAKYIIGTMEFFMSNAFENTMGSYYPFVNADEVPAENFGAGCLYMIAMCHVIMGDYEAACEKLKTIVLCAKKAESKSGTSNLSHKYIAIYTYLNAMCVIKEHKKVMQYLEIFFNDDNLQFINKVFADPSKVIILQYPGSTIHQGVDNLDFYHEDYVTISKFNKKLRDSQSETNISQSTIAQIIETIIG
ncbi:MAG TPA: YcaO-like family protein [Clostridiaceae bacterium]|nr:YcaO-like family protein [Clostridiaceae bacterium]